MTLGMPPENRSQMIPSDRPCCITYQSSVREPVLARHLLPAPLHLVPVPVPWADAEGLCRAPRSCAYDETLPVSAPLDPVTCLALRASTSVAVR
jgi:hypothetical protein